MATKKTKAQLDAELKLLRKVNHIEGGYSLLGKLTYGGTIFGVFYWIFRMVEVVTGTETTADIMISFLAEIDIVISFAVGGTGVAYGWWQRKLRRDTVEKLQGRIKELELEYDPKRSTSGLTTRGDTQPEDKI